MDLHIRTPLDLRRLQRPDLEALASLKLWEELGVSVRDAIPLLTDVSASWLSTFLENGAPCIGSMILDARTLVRARKFYARVVEPAVAVSVGATAARR